MRVLTLLLPLLTLICPFQTIFSNESSKVFTPSVSGKTPYDDNKQLVSDFYSAFQDNDLQKLNDLLTTDYQVINVGDLQDSSYSKYTEMSKNLKVRITALHKALPSFKLDVSEILTDGNKVLARITISGIQKGSFLGIGPTNKPIHIKFFDVFTIKDGKIIHLAEMWNELSVMKQLGFIVL